MGTARVALLGANGQVGAELSLLLGALPSVTLVPVCRYRSGSAFLRWNGIACRHGRITDAAEAAALIGDCDVIVNSALARGSPREMRRTEDEIVAAIFRHAKPGAIVVHFSTQSVYGDASPASLLRWQSQYGRAKLATERRVRQCARRTGRAAFIFRLGHVCGPLQQISLNMREEILRGEVVLPADDVASNCVYTATIRDAILAAIEGRLAAGTYDLMNHPQWTWREVYQFEAAHAGLPLTIEQGDGPARVSLRQIAAGAARRPFAALVQNTRLRELAASAIGRVPERWSRRAQAVWYSLRARSQVGALTTRRRAAEHLSWVANGRKFPAGIPSTATTLASKPYDNLQRGVRDAWPGDLPAAGAGP